MSLHSQVFPSTGFTKSCALLDMFVKIQAALGFQAILMPHVPRASNDYDFFTHLQTRVRRKHYFFFLSKTKEVIPLPRLEPGSLM